MWQQFNYFIKMDFKKGTWPVRKLKSKKERKKKEKKI